MSRTINDVTLRGFVGTYIKLPEQSDVPARFDIQTVDRLMTVEGEVINAKDWHTVATGDREFVQGLQPGMLVDVRGRLTTRRSNGARVVEIAARQMEIVDENENGPRRRRRRGA